MIYLLDANVLISAVTIVHDSHPRALRWLRTGVEFAVCPIVEGSLARFLLRKGAKDQIAPFLERVHSFSHFHWIDDDLTYADVYWDDVIGHKQATDVYLASLAVAHGMKLATFDEGIAQLRPEDTFLVPKE